MGIARIILGFDKKDFEELKGKQKLVEEHVDRLDRKIEILQDNLTKIPEELNSIIEAIQQLRAEIEELKQEITQLKTLHQENTTRIEELEETMEYITLHNQKENHNETDNTEIEDTVLELVIKGINTPSEIIEKSGLTRSRVYSALRRLVERGILVKQKEGRKVHYILASETTITQ